MAYSNDSKIFSNFMEKVHKTSSCWFWLGSKHPRGYGAFRGGSTNKAHRYSYEHFIGPIPDGMSVCHRCDNPSCVNPEHLFVGTHTDNMKDKMSKGRGNHLVGSLHPRSKLTEQDVIAIRADSRKQIEIAAAYGIKQAQVSEIKRRVAWSHI